MKRMLSLLLTVTMLLTSFPLAALAEGRRGFRGLLWRQSALSVAFAPWHWRVSASGAGDGRKRPCETSIGLGCLSTRPARRTNPKAVKAPQAARGCPRRAVLGAHGGLLVFG